MLTEVFKLPQLSLLQTITAGKIDAMKSVKFLTENGNIPEDFIAMFDEMYLQKCDEYCSRETFCVDKNRGSYIKW